MAEAMTIAAVEAPRRPFRERHLIPAFDQDGRIVAQITTSTGRLLLFAIMLVLAYGDPALMAAIAFGAAVAYLPSHRGALIVVATVSAALFRPWLNGGTLPTVGEALATLGVFGFAAVLLAVARRVGRRGPLAHPVLSLLVLIASLAAVGSIQRLGLTLQSVVWSIATALSAAMWFIAYALANATGRQPKPLTRHLGVLHPFWGSTTVPYGKGAAFLAKFEARTETELAVTQIKAAKLLLWAKLLLVAGLGFRALVHTQAGVPTLHEAVDALAAGHPWSRPLSMAAIPANFVDSLISLTVTGHIFVACARYAGFRLPRNTYRPLQAASIADFWNRYYFYFKELLVDFFFMPTFSRLNRWPAKARVVAATFCAAGLGNYLFHFFRDIDLVRTLGPVQALVGSQTSVFYCFMLSIGIAGSQLGGAPPAGTEVSTITRAAAIVRIIGFYCLMSVFAYEGRTLTLADHFHFIFYAIGVSS